MDINNSKILITGGSSGIGKQTAIDLIKKGAKVVITGRDQEKLYQVAQEIGAIPLIFDISNLASIPPKAQEALDILEGEIDVLINNAGIGEFPLLGEITEDMLARVYQTNVFGLALLTQELVKPMKAKQSGTIINIGSTASLKGFARGSVYAASKFAVRGMTQSWQAELRKDNIRVVLVNPSEVTTAFANEERVERPDEAKKLSPQEIADTIVYTIAMDNRGFVPEVDIWATNPF